ncbi:AvrD family protein [Streptomyces diastatochromogenes]|uniref:AvrD family protein n=1 Tax=Streptomyces diastatochromogenes TaxID=42236 RepID=UPI0036CC76F2
MSVQSASPVLPAAAPPYLADVSDYLGAPERRFFGEGYKRARHHLTGFHIPEADGAAAEAPRLGATARVTYPSDWSRKGEVDQRPHLSTVDVLLLAAQLTEALLTAHLGLTERELATVWLARVRIKAGSRPVEDDLAGFPVTAYVADRLPSPQPGCARTAVEATVGTLRVRLEADHPDIRPGERPAVEPAVRDGGYGDAGRLGGQRVESMQVRPGTNVATADVRLSGGPDGVLGGMEGEHQPSVHLVDAFVTALQVGQVLLYELDQVPRSASDTLWMRSTLLEAATPHRPRIAPDGGPLPLRAELRDAVLLNNRHGETWRRADIVATLADITVVCSVAHRLSQTTT